MRASIEKLSAHILNQPHLDESEKDELLGLLAEIESEIDPDEKGHEPVKSTVEMTADVASDSFPSQLQENLLKIEVAYPKTASALTRIADVLGRMGI